MSALESLNKLGDNRSVPLTMEYHRDQATGELRLQKRLRPLHCSVQLLGTLIEAEVIGRSNGACFFFKTHIGKVPFRAAGDSSRDTVLEVLSRLGKDIGLIASDIDLTLTPRGDVQMRSSFVTDTAPDLATFFTALANYAQDIRPFLLELKPLLQNK